MPNPSLPIPDGWDFDPDFLDDPTQLPPYVPAVACSLHGTGYRPTREDLESALPTADAPGSLGERDAHAVVLEGVRAVVEDREQERHRLHGPARLVLPEAVLNRHMLWVGPPGVGKTSRGILPMVRGLIDDRERSLVVFDPKGDQFALIQQLARQAGRSGRVQRLNLCDPATSLGWNPLRAGLTRTVALNLATTLVTASEHRESREGPFWRNNSIDLIVDVLLGLDGDTEEPLTLPRLLEVLEQPRRDLIDWLNGHGAHKFAQFLESGNLNAETCLADTTMRLVPLLDLDLCAVLSTAQLDLTRLVRKPTILVVEMSETRLEPLRPIFNLLVQQIFDHAIREAERFDDSRLRRPLTVVIDEFASAIGEIPRFPTYLNTLRSRRVSVVAAVQGLSQIRAIYGPEADPVIDGFSSKVYFAGVAPRDAEIASAASGTMTVEMPSESGSSQWIPRRVLLAEEIARPRIHPVLGAPVTFDLVDLPCFQAYLTPHFRVGAFVEALRANATRRPRRSRRTPLVYRPRTRRRLGRTDVQGLDRAKLSRHVDVLQLQIGYDRATPMARLTWDSWRKRLKSKPTEMLRLCEQIRDRGLDLNAFFEARTEAGCGDPFVVLLFVDYREARERHERRRRDAS